MCMAQVEMWPLIVCVLLQREEADWLGYRHFLAHFRGAPRGGFRECPAHHSQLCKYEQTEIYRCDGAGSSGVLMGCSSLTFR